MITVAVGDLHGDYVKLVELHEKVEDYLGPQKFRYIFLGDSIDRGPNSKDVVDWLVFRKHRKLHDVFLMGNHDQMFLSHWYTFNNNEINRRALISCFYGNGGVQTMQSYGMTGIPEEDITMIDAKIPQDHIEFFSSLRLYYDDGKRLFVHAGIHPSKAMHEQRIDDLLWIRDEFLRWNNPYKIDRYIVHGHTPNLKGPEITDYRCNLDTGGCFGGSLSAGIFDDSQLKPIHIISVK